MSKKYYVGHDDGRAVFLSEHYDRFLVQEENCNNKAHLFYSTSRKKAEIVAERAQQAGWIGFKAKRLKK